MVEAILKMSMDPNLRGKGPVTEWYNGRSIFITGASGFMGKVLLEKLLYQCTGIKNIYVLMRDKRGKTAEHRVKDMWNLPMFSRLKKHDPNAINKVIPVIGDIQSKALGLSVAERTALIENVTIIFHCAATLKLEAKLKDAITMNTSGTEKVLELAKEMKGLKVFVHLSTTFCSADIEVLEEKVYPSDNPKEVIQVVDWMRPDALELATAAVISPHPNTYTYSKRLSETLVANELPYLPVVIARPSIVTPAGFEPLPGWVDSLNGPMGIIVAAGKGVIRSMHVKPENRAQVVPVDVAISALIVIGWKHGSSSVKPAEVPVYNMTNDAVKPMTWGETLKVGLAIGYANPFEGQIWYPDGDIRSSLLMHRICCFFFHWIPAYLIDFIMIIIRQKRFMVRLMKRIDDGLELLQFFTTREWIFKSENFLELNSAMTALDREIYRIDFEALEVEEYFTIALLGARQYLMKEDLSTLPRCRRVQSVLYLIDRAFAAAFYLGLIWILWSCSDTVQFIFDAVGFYLKNVPVIGSLVPM